MLRTIFVIILIIIGIVASFYGSFNALIFYLWIAYFRPESWVWINFISSLNLSLFVGVYLLISTVITGVKFRFTLFAGLLSLAAVDSLMSTLLSNYNASISSWVEFLKLIVMSYLLTILIRTVKDLKIALIVISLSLGLEGAKQGWARLIISPGSINTNGHPFLGDNNGVAIGMIMLIPILLALYQTTERKLIKYGFLFLMIGVAYRALSTYSRGGFLAFIAMCVIYWLRSKHKIRSLLVIALLSALLLPTLPQQFWDRMNTITVGEDEEREASAASRLYYWGLAWEMALNNPLSGVGHNSYSRAYNDYDITGGKYGPSRAVHSSWFGILAEWGFPGLILFLVLYFYSLFLCANTRIKCKNNPRFKLLGIYSTSIETSLIASAVGITFLTFQYLEMLWHFFALAVVCSQIVRANVDASELQNETTISVGEEYAQVPQYGTITPTNEQIRLNSL